MKIKELEQILLKKQIDKKCPASGDIEHGYIRQYHTWHNYSLIPYPVESLYEVSASLSVC